jgi:nitronate monooxygenase
MTSDFAKDVGIEVPIICGPMYPCSNPELVAAVSQAGGIGVVQPISLTYVHGYDFREGLKYIKSLTSKPIGFNALIEKSSKRYEDKMQRWVDIALQEGVRFFITSLGKPKWVVDEVSKHGGLVYHDVTERKWAEKALESQVNGFIAVNNRAGGHAGPKSKEELFEELKDLGLPIICAGGIGSPEEFKQALSLGYQGAQLGTRFIASTECRASDAYKQAIVNSKESDIVLSERLTGVPVSLINTPYIERIGLKAGPLARWMLKGRKTKHWMRTIYALRSIFQLKQSLMNEDKKSEFWQAGKSVQNINSIEPVDKILKDFSSRSACR